MRQINYIFFISLVVSLLIIIGCKTKPKPEPKPLKSEMEIKDAIVYNEDKKVQDNVKQKEALIKKLIEQRNKRKTQKEEKKPLLVAIEPLEEDPEKLERDYDQKVEPEKEVEPIISSNDKDAILNAIAADLKRYKEMGIPPIRDERINELIPIVYFDFDDSRIKTEFRKPLQKSVKWLLAELENRDDMVLQIEGHADERGSAEYNVALGYRRANNVFKMIQVYTLKTEEILKVVSFGEEFPAVKGSNEEAWGQNRRVQFRLLLKE